MDVELAMAARPGLATVSGINSFELGDADAQVPMAAGPTGTNFKSESNLTVKLRLDSDCGMSSVLRLRVWSCRPSLGVQPDFAH